MGPKCGYVTFSAFAVVFLILGVVLQLTSGTEPLQVEVYKNGETEKFFRFPVDVEGDIVLFYELRNFHQNHRRFVTHRSSDQLSGKYMSLDDLKKAGECENLDANPQGKVYVPCGLAARSFFTDQFKVDAGSERVFSEEGIAAEGDKKMFSPPSPQYDDSNADWVLGWLENNQTNEHFIVWMRPAALPTVVKPYAVCRGCKFSKDEEIRVQILRNDYDVGMFKGEKAVGIGVDSWVGFRNKSMGIICFIHAGVWIVCLVVLLIIRFLVPRKIGDQDLIVQRCREYAAEFGRS